jgi:hypothetical protein
LKRNGTWGHTSYDSELKAADYRIESKVGPSQDLLHAGYTSRGIHLLVLLVNPKGKKAQVINHAGTYLFMLTVARIAATTRTPFIIGHLLDRPIDRPGIGLMPEAAAS